MCMPTLRNPKLWCYIAPASLHVLFDSMGLPSRQILVGLCCPTSASQGGKLSVLLRAVVVAFDNKYRGFLLTI